VAVGSNEAIGLTKGGEIPKFFFWGLSPILLRTEILSQFQEPYGDRRTEIFIIGRDMDRTELLARFQACLLTQEEMKGGPNAWTQLPDPFDEWAAIEVKPA
jgi:hypothetical protein